MAARKDRIQIDENTRKKIQASQLINSLQNHVLNDTEMTPTQVKAAETLLDRILPKMKQVEMVGEIEHSGELKISWQK